MLFKKGVLKNFALFIGKHLWWSLFLIHLQALRPVFPSYLNFIMQLYLKETPAQVFSCEYCKIFKNTYFEEHLRTAASIKNKLNVRNRNARKSRTENKNKKIRFSDIATPHKKWGFPLRISSVNVTKSARNFLLATMHKSSSIIQTLQMFQQIQNQIYLSSS